MVSNVQRAVTPSHSWTLTGFMCQMCNSYESLHSPACEKEQSVMCVLICHREKSGYILSCYINP